MKIENQVCTLEQAKRLKELGVEAVPLYWHYCGFMTEKHGIVQYDFVLRYNSAHAVYPAFTVAELGAMLPLYYYSYEGDNGKEWYCLYDGNESLYEKYEFTNSKTEAEARAKMLIHLLETGEITATDCNNRLNSDI